MPTLHEVHDKTAAALAATERDEKASPVLVALVREFAHKADKALELAGAGRQRDAVIELEQARRSSCAT